MRFATFLQPHFIFYIQNTHKTIISISSSGTLNIGTNGSITVSGSNYGTLSCSSSNTNIATCSVSGTTVTIVPKAVGTATITVTGAGGTNYNSISKTYAATVQTGTTYVYWAAIDPSSSIGATNQTCSSLKNTQPVVDYCSSSTSRASTPSGICASTKVYCPMFRDIYQANTYMDRELCIYISTSDKLLCLSRDYWTSSHSATRTKLQNDIQTKLGMTPSCSNWTNNVSCKVTDSTNTNLFFYVEPSYLNADVTEYTIRGWSYDGTNGIWNYTQFYGGDKTASGNYHSKKRQSGYN